MTNDPVFTSRTQPRMTRLQALSMLLGGWLLGAPVPAVAADYVLTNPGVESSWGGGPEGPVAPNSQRDAGRDISGPIAARRYEADMLAAKPGLDEAASFHWFELTPLYLSMHGVTPAPDIAGPQAQRALRDKQDEVRGALIAELDTRFARLTDALEKADAIVLPVGDQAGTSGPVPYCSWIADRAQYAFTPLGKDLLARCLEDRDVLIGRLALRLATLALVPDLPSGAASPPTASAGRITSDAAANALAGLRDSGAVLPSTRLSFSQAILPADRRWPLDYASLFKLYERALRTRFEAKRDQLSARLQQALQVVDASDTILPAEGACRAILGPYAGSLAQDAASAPVAEMLRNTCSGTISEHNAASLSRIRAAVVAGFDAMAAEASRDATGTTRVVHTPEAACQVALQPYFPSQVLGPKVGGSLAGLTQAQVTNLKDACIAAAGRLNAAVVRRHVADALAQTDGDAGTLAAWEAAFWSPGATGRLDWIGGEDLATVGATMTAFRAAYEAGMAPRRAAAARRWAGEIEKAFAVDIGEEPPEAVKLCATHYRGTSDDIMQSWFGVQPSEVAVARAMDVIRAEPAISAQEAQYWIAGLCRSLHERTIARRVSMATERAGIPAMFKEGEDLAVPSPEGRLQFFDPTRLVRAAAVDGLQIAFVEADYGNDAQMRVTPLGKLAPALEGALQTTTRGDDAAVMKLVRLTSLRGMDGSLATVECVGTPVQEAYRQGRAEMLRGYALALFDDLPVAGSLVANDARRAMFDVMACDAAKTAFKQSGIRE